MNKFCIIIKEYLGYKNSKPNYGKARQLTITTVLSLDELRDGLAKDYDIPIRGVGRPKKVKK